MSTQPAGGAAAAHNAMVKIVESEPAPPPVEQPEPEAITDGAPKEK